MREHACLSHPVDGNSRIAEFMPAATLEYLKILAAARSDALVVTTMTAAKLWPRVSDSPWDVGYLPSAMSHAGDIALGLALAQPGRRVVCVNGDGSLLMNLGSLVTAAAAEARNLLMLVLVNGTYEMVGGGRVPGAGRTDYAALARASGWPVAVDYEDADGFAAALPELLQAEGPAFAALVVVDPPQLPLALPRHPGDVLRAMRQANAAR